MRRTAKTTVATGVATGVIVLGGASALAFLSPSGTSSAGDDQAATTARMDDDQAATAARTSDDSEFDDTATATRTEEPAPQATFSDQEGGQKTVTFEPDRQGDQASSRHSQGTGATDPDDANQAGRPAAAPNRPSGGHEGGGD